MSYVSLNELTYLKTFCETLVTSGWFNNSYVGLSNNMTGKRIIAIRPVECDDQDDDGQPLWGGRFEFLIGLSQPVGKTDAYIGTASEPGLVYLTEVVQESLAKSLDALDYFYEVGPVRYEQFTQHPQFVARFFLDITKGINTRDRARDASVGIVVPGLTPASLNDLADVSVSSPSTGQVLTFSGGVWQALAGGSASLEALTDTTITTPAANELLKYDGSKWVNGSASLANLSDTSIVGPASGDRLEYNGSEWTNVTPTQTVLLSAFLDQNKKNTDVRMHGGIHLLTSAGTLSNVSNVTATAGASKIYVCLLAGSDFSGSLTVSGDTVDRDTGSVTSGDTETLTVTTLTTDLSSTDANGNTVYGFTAGYLTSKLFTGNITISTTNLNISDVDVYGVAFEQFNDCSSVEIQTFDVTTYITNAAARFNAYLYGLTWNAAKGSKYDIATISTLEMNTPTANKFYRLRRGNLGETLDGTREGVWVDVHFRPTAQTYFESVNVKVWGAVC